MTEKDFKLSGSHDTIDAGENNDYIVLKGYRYNSAVGGNLDISCSNGHVSINAGTGNDTISGFYGADSLVGGAGDDSIITAGSKNLFLYAEGDGDDSIKGIGETDTINVTEGLITSAKINDGKVILTVGNGSITLVDSLNKKFNLREADGTLTKRVYDKDSNGEVV